MKPSTKSNPAWIRKLLLLSATVGLLGSCTDQDPVRPAPASPRPSAVSTASGVERGCADFEVRVAGRGRIQVVQDTSVRCGPVQPLLGGEPTFDVTGRLVRLPIALENRAQRKLKAPARLYGREDSLIVVSPSGLSRNKHSSSYLDFASPDSVGAEEGAVRAWRYDGQFTAAGSLRLLAVGHRSDVRWVEITVHPGVESFRVRMHSSALRASRPVPATAPDTIPDDLYGNPDRILENSPYFSLSNKVLRDVVSVQFTAVTPQTERQDAVDAVGGEVIGGQPLRGMEGYYLVQVADDGTGKQMSEAIDRLNAMPGVGIAEPEYLFDRGERLLWLKPKDDESWSGEWMLDPTRADGRNWALEAIAAPLAWGCSTGDAATRIGVVDNGFLSHPDLMPNVSYQLGLDRFKGWGTWANDHGTRVASVIGARGNNGQGISGVMWNSGLMLLDSSSPEEDYSSFVRVIRRIVVTWPTPDLKLQRIQVRQALDQGASVINISSGSQGVWKKRSVPLEDRIREVTRDALAMKYILDQSSNKALVVVAAGNERVDAAWTGYPLLAAELPDQVITVGAVSGVGADDAVMWEQSAYNSSESPFPKKHHNLVELYAPGEDVAALGEGKLADWTISSGDGTSYSAPLVAGVAGLLKSFDPRLTTREIKDLLIRGSQRSGRLVVGAGGSRFVLNAYESLKLAAERPGAPLCGNRVWISGGRAVSRRAGSGGTELETLFPVAGKVSGVNVLHGGRRIRYFDHASWKSKVYALRDGAWRDLPSTDPEYVSAMKEYGPSYVSLWNVSHDRDTVAYTRDGEVRLWERSTGKDWLLTRIPIGSSSSYTEECIAASEPGKCWSHWGGREKVLVGSRTSSQLNPGVGYSPMGDVIYVGWAQGRDWTRLASDWYSLEEEIEGFGVPKWFRKWESGGAITHGRVYEISIATGEKRVVVEGSDAVFENMAVAEGGRELALLRRRQSGAGRYEWTWNPDDKSLYLTTTSLGFVMECRSQYHDARDGSTLQVLDTCEFSATTFSPDRSPGAGPVISW